jgi:hypothetical protein
LTYAEDFPALSLGYRLPAYHLAIEVTQQAVSIDPGKILYFPRRQFLCAPILTAFTFRLFDARE